MRLCTISCCLICWLFWASCEMNDKPLQVGSKLDLERALAEVAGLYNDPSKQRGFEKTVLITGCDQGYLNHLHNFKCFADRLGMKFLVVSMHEDAHKHITKNTNMKSHLYANITGGKFRTPEFNLLTAKKIEAVHDMLRLGYDVLFSDVDVVMVQDPMPLLMWQNVDYVHSLNAVCAKDDTWEFRRSKEEGNTGFYFVRSSERTIKLWADTFEAAPKFPGLDDQAIFWRIIRQSRDPPVHPIGTCRHVDRQREGKLNDLTTCVLSTCAFSSGMLSRLWVPEYTYDELLLNLELRNESMYTLHANYITGNHPKMHKLQQRGLWLPTKVHESSDHWNGPCKPLVFRNGSEGAAEEWGQAAACTHFAHKRNVDWFKDACDMPAVGDMHGAVSCCAACQQAEGCRGFTYFQEVCYLKSCSAPKSDLHVHGAVSAHLK